MVANYEPDVGYAWWLMERYWCLIAEELASQGRSAILAYPKRGSIPEHIVAAGIKVAWLDYGNRSRRGRIELEALIRENQVESIYLTDRPYIDLRYVRLRSAGVRMVVVHDHTPGDRAAVDGLKGIAKSAVRAGGPWAADLCVAVSEFVRQRLIRNGRVPASRTAVVPNGVQDYQYAIDDRTWARRELQVSDDDLVVGIVARANKYKGIEFAIEVARAVLESGSRAVFFLIGDGPDLPGFRELARSAGLGARFRFAGRRSDVRRLMAGFDLGFHPSMGEVGYCLAILELMNAGLPVVVPDRPSVRGATEPGTTGLWYEADSVVACSQALKSLLDSPTARGAMGSAARQRTLTHFSLKLADATFRNEVARRL